MLPEPIKKLYEVLQLLAVSRGFSELILNNSFCVMPSTDPQSNLFPELSGGPRTRSNMSRSGQDGSNVLISDLSNLSLANQKLPSIANDEKDSKTSKTKHKKSEKSTEKPVELQEEQATPHEDTKDHQEDSSDNQSIDERLVFKLEGAGCTYGPVDCVCRPVGSDKESVQYECNYELNEPNHERSEVGEEPKELQTSQKAARISGKFAMNMP